MKEIMIGLLFLLGGVQLSSAQSSIQCIAENNYNLTVPTIPEYDFGHGDFTLEAFIKVDTITTGLPQFPTILAHRQNRHEPGFTFFVYRNTSGNSRSGVILSGEYYYSAAGPNIMDNNCHQIAVTRYQGTLSFYVDGQLVRTGQVSLDDVYSPRPLRMGRFGYNGTLDEVRIWNVARTEQEQQDYLTTPLLGTETGLVGYWKMDEGSGQIIADSSPLANHGVLGDSENDFLNDPEWTTSECHPRTEYDLSVLENHNTTIACDSLWVRVRNVGLRPIHSFDLVYRLNEGIDNSISYNGTINPNETVRILLFSNAADLLLSPTIDLTLIVTLNDETDSNPRNNTKSMLLYYGAYEVAVSIMTDDYPEETSFDITDENGDIVYQQRETAFPLDSSLYEFSTCLPNGCYTFTIYDAYEDGICCGWGQGYYELFVEDSFLASGGPFLDSESHAFCVGEDTDIKDTRTPNIFPNPSIRAIYISDHVSEPTPQNIQLLDIQGREILRVSQAILYPFYKLDVSGLESGTYFLHMVDQVSKHRTIQKVQVIK